MSAPSPSPRLQRVDRDMKVAIVLWALVAVFCSVMANVLAAKVI